MYRLYPFSKKKQWKAKDKVKETDPTCSQIWLFPGTGFYLLLPGHHPPPTRAVKPFSRLRGLMALSLREQLGCKQDASLIRSQRSEKETEPPSPPSLGSLVMTGNRLTSVFKISRSGHQALTSFLPPGA